MFCSLSVILFAKDRKQTARPVHRIRSFIFSDWGGLRGFAGGEFGGSVYFRAAWEATKHNRWALCDIALGFVENPQLNQPSALSFPLERRTKGSPCCSFYRGLSRMALVYGVFFSEKVPDTIGKVC
jgi:hypothetical protein